MKKLLLGLFAASLVFSAVGCTKKQKTLSGAGIGMGTGALVGGAVGGTGGAVAGAIGGGAVGALVGNQS